MLARVSFEFPKWKCHDIASSPARFSTALLLTVTWHKLKQEHKQAQMQGCFSSFHSLHLNNTLRKVDKQEEFVGFEEAKQTHEGRK